MGNSHNRAYIKWRKWQYDDTQKTPSGLGSEVTPARHRILHQTLTALLVVVITAVAGCEKPAPPPDTAAPMPSIEQASHIIGQMLGEPQAKRFFVGSDEELEELERLGLLKYTPRSDQPPYPPRQITLTDEGQALGLTIDIPEPDWPWGPSGVEAEGLCELAFGEVTQITPNASGPLPAAEVSYVRRNGNHSELYQWLKAAGSTLGDYYCDVAKTEAGRSLLVLRENGWHVNRPPVFDGEVSSETRYEYDELGRRIGAVTTITLSGEFSDPDGDPIHGVAWSASTLIPDREGEDAHFEPAELEVDGMTATLKHYIFMGERSGAVVYYEASDPWESGKQHICIEGYGFSC